MTATVATGKHSPSKAKVIMNRLHLDFRPDDQTAEVDRLLALGAHRVDIGQEEQRWVVLADPEGNEFCVLAPRRETLALQQRRQHNAAMTRSITIRDVPDETSDELAARAALTGRSLQEYLRSRLVELAEAPDAEVLMARIRARKAATSSSTSADQILAHRDADRR